MPDDDDRTTAVGLFNFAHSYWRSAATLRAHPAKATHPEDPAWFLYCHAIELYLKAFLRSRDVSVMALRRDYGHNVNRLAADARERGLCFDNEDHEVVKLMMEMDVLTVRYIRRGAFTRPTLDALDRTCASFHGSIATALRCNGHRIRDYPLE
ncbi:MAG: hypothetical protein IPK81_18255 [Rhodospirillales bacterium]|nr:MAG: hypothetical protein IPK81_18255 [Rhodospirillales bacterium]